MIKLVVFDIDGVLTDGSYLIDSVNNEYKKISFKDLDSFTLIKELKIDTLFLTGEKNNISEYFNQKFKPKYFIDGANEKFKMLKEFCTINQYKLEEVCYVGDGKKDLECMKNVKISIAPLNAIQEIKNISTCNLCVKGGEGVVYEVYQILKKEFDVIKYEKHHLETKIDEVLEKHCNIIEMIKNNYELISNIEHANHIMQQALKNKHIIYACGNGGSAGDAQHFVAELISKFNYDRMSLGALALTTNSSIMTSIGNDYDFDKIFSRQIEGIGKTGDVLFAITTSGNSNNILFAIDEAKRKKMQIILLTSTKCNLVSNEDLIVIKIPSNETPRIQEFHIMIIHYLCEKIENYCMDVLNEK